MENEICVGCCLCGCVAAVCCLCIALHGGDGHGCGRREKTGDEGEKNKI